MVSSRPLTDDECRQAVEAYHSCGSKQEAADKLQIPRTTFNNRLQTAVRRGMMGYKPVLPGFAITETSTKMDGVWVKQKPEATEKFEMPEGQRLKEVSALVDHNELVHWKWVKTTEDKGATEASIKAAIEELKATLPRLDPTPPPEHTEENLLSQYTLTDLHFGMLAWAEETKGDDYNLKIAEKLLFDWFTQAVSMSPRASVGVLAQLGDLLHYDSLKAVTPEHRNVLDSDSRFQKIVRVVIRVFRQIIQMMLQKHDKVHVVMCSANHDPASSSWLREMFSVLYENEPRVTIDISPSEYYAYEWGSVALFYHHGHRRKVENVDHVFAGMFREMFGRCSYSYGHVGHLHTDRVDDTNLMRVERHRTIAPSDAFASSSGYLAKRDAKVITYHRLWGEVSRITLTPQMVTHVAAA